VPPLVSKPPFPVINPPPNKKPNKYRKKQKKKKLISDQVDFSVMISDQ
jgi:hypothetical protein